MTNVMVFTSNTRIGPDQIDGYWQRYLRRFDLEHTFRLLKQDLGWRAPQICTAATGDRWT